MIDWSQKEVLILAFDHRSSFKEKLFGIKNRTLTSEERNTSEVKYFSCFICYGQPDLKFAQKLRNKLNEKGVSCWLYDTDATVGKKTWYEITLKRRETEKMIVICSLKSLLRDGMRKEIEEQMDEGEDKIIPISLDDDWKMEGFQVKRGQIDLKPFLLERNYADFKKLDFDKALNKLLGGIKRTEVNTNSLENIVA